MGARAAAGASCAAVLVLCWRRRSQRLRELEMGDGAVVTHDWSLWKWLQSLPLHEVVACALSVPHGHDAFEWMKALPHRELRKRLRAAGLEGLAEPIACASRSLAEQIVPTAEEYSAKFISSSFEMAFASTAEFFGGLETLIGSPTMVHGSIMTSMDHEHLQRDDSHREFTSTNGVATTSALEWEFVASPVAGKNYPQRARPADASGEPLRLRAPLTWEALMARMRTKSDELERNGHLPLLIEEVVAVRLYTGPMYEKMNASLRAKSGNAHLMTRWQELCGSNSYVTTIHACSSAVVKLSKLLRACAVYRGLAGATLPSSFLVEDNLGVRGGVEYAFMSTSAERTQAMSYTSGGRSAIVVEMQLGLIDRGADVSWVSQFPAEAEVLFPPLTAMAVQDTRVDKSTLVIDVRLSLNLVALTLDQVIGKRRQLLRDQWDSQSAELRTILRAKIDLQPNKFCVASRRPIKGVCYTKGSGLNHGDHLCADEFEKLTDATKTAYRMVPPPVTDAIIASRLWLAESIVHQVIFRDGLRTTDWYNSDDNYVTCTMLLVMIKQELERFEPTAPLLTRMSLDEMCAAPWGMDGLVAMQALNTYEAATVTTAPQGLAQSTDILKLLVDPRTFVLGNRPNLESVPEALLVLGNSLTRLDLHACTKLLALPERLDLLTELVELRCDACYVLEALPDGLCECAKLERLTLSDCKRLRRLPDNIGRLAQLQRLMLDKCAILQELPDSLCDCASLAQLLLNGCIALRTLPERTGQLPSLHTLALDCCLQLQVLPSSIVHAPRLRYLILSRCEALTQLPAGFEQLVQRRVLSLVNVLDSSIEINDELLAQMLNAEVTVVPFYDEREDDVGEPGAFYTEPVEDYLSRTGITQLPESE